MSKVPIPMMAVISPRKRRSSCTTPKPKKRRTVSGVKMTLTSTAIQATTSIAFCTNFLSTLEGKHLLIMRFVSFVIMRFVSFIQESTVEPQYSDHSAFSAAIISVFSPAYLGVHGCSGEGERERESTVPIILSPSMVS